MNGQYKRIRIEGKEFFVHRLVWEMEHGPIPIGHVVHHRDGNKHNNAIDNLECIPRSQHCAHHQHEERGTPEYSAMKSRAAKARPLHAYKCAHCAIDFMAVSVASASRRFCSKRCKNAMKVIERKTA